MKLPDDFDPDWYAASFPDVAASGMSPANHYMRLGVPLRRPANGTHQTSTSAASSFLTTRQRVAGQRPTMVWISGESHTAGHRYRVQRPLSAARSLGINAKWIQPESIPDHLDHIKHADLLFIWRARWSGDIAAAVSAAREGGTLVVFDVDDLMFAPEIATASVVDGIRTQGLTEEEVRCIYREIRQTLNQADLCVAPTEELASHMRRAGKPALVIPNTFDPETRIKSLTARKRCSSGEQDGLVRIGYASGSRTHQKDFAVCVEAVAKILTENSRCRLVLFRSRSHNHDNLDVSEFPCLSGLESKIEWRDAVALEDLPGELARFDINLAPLEHGNVFCEAKSELKFFEAALCCVPTIASPTGPFMRAIAHGENGFLAATTDEWHRYLGLLINDEDLREKIGTAANCQVQWAFGPERLRHDMELLAGLADPETSHLHFPRLALARSTRPSHQPQIPEYRIVSRFTGQDAANSRATVVITVFNYEAFVTEALNSVVAQTARPLDLVIVDDQSTDSSLQAAMEWCGRHGEHLRNTIVVQTTANSGLGAARNLGFALAQTEWIMVLDADNRLLPACIERCLRTAEEKGSSVAYPLIQCFGARSNLLGGLTWNPIRFIGGNYVDAMALVARSAWTAVGGYDTTRTGWEDYDLWCKFAFKGFRGTLVPGEPLAEYRAHNGSMMNTTMAQDHKVSFIVEHLQSRHPWLNVLK